MPISWEQHKDVDYLYLDYRGFSDLDIMKQTLEFGEMLTLMEDHSLCVIIDVTGINMSFSSYTKVKIVGKQAQEKVYKSIFVGLSKYSKTFYSVYKKFTGTRALLLDTLDLAKMNIVSEQKIANY